MRPGVDYYLSIDDVPLETSQGSQLCRSANLRHNLANYQLYQALMQGGAAVLWPPAGTLHPVSKLPLDGGSYLTRLRGETRVKAFHGMDYDPFRDRVNQSVHVPIASEIIGIYVNTLFRQMIDRQPVAEALGAEYMANVDMLGHGAEDFLAYVYTIGLALGWCAVLTDLPRIDPGDVPSRAHEEALGIRPYSRVLSPTRIWQWERDSVTGELVWALIHEQPERWRLWTADAWRLLDRDGDVIDEDEHDFGKVPIDLFVAQEPTSGEAEPPIGVSAINSSSLLQLQLDQMQSLSDELQRKTNYPLLHVELDSEEIQEPQGGQPKTAGPGFMMFYRAAVNWIAPPDVCMKAAREHILDLESKIYKAQGVHRRSQDSVEAHSGLALDYESSPIYATVQAWARQLRTFENRYWRTVAAMRGIDLPETDLVTYPEDFSVRPVDLEIKQAKAVTEIYGGFELCPAEVKRYVNIKVGTAMARDKGHLADVPKMVRDLAGETYDAPELTAPVDFEVVDRDVDTGADAPEEAEIVAGEDVKVEAQNAVDPTTALNGAQVTSLREIVLDVAKRAIPRETGVAMIVAAFPLDEQQADAVMGPVGRTFFAEPEEPKPEPDDG